jgi:aspartate kinase
MIIWGEAIKIVTGFIASNPGGQTITLGRNGSDYTASLLARCSGAERITLWTDVPGIYTADPRIVKTAQPIARLSYEEEMALASVGTNVLHQKTINPLQSHHIPLYVRSSLKPHLPGTQVCRHGDERQPIKSLALKPDLVKVLLRQVTQGDLVNVQHQLFEANVPSLVSTCAETGEGPPVSAVLLAASSVDKACALLYARGVDSEVLPDRRAVVAIVGQELAASINASSIDGSAIGVDSVGGYSHHFMSLLSTRLPGVQHAVIDHKLEHALFIETCAAEAANVLAQVHALSFEELSVQTQSVEAVASTLKA